MTPRVTAILEDHRQVIEDEEVHGQFGCGAPRSGRPTGKEHEHSSRHTEDDRKPVLRRPTAPSLLNSGIARLQSPRRGHLLQESTRTLGRIHALLESPEQRIEQRGFSPPTAQCTLGALQHTQREAVDRLGYRQA